MQVRRKIVVRQWFAAAAIALTLLALLAARNVTDAASGSGPKVVEMRDNCDPATFNANIGPGACVGRGNLTLDRFIAELTKDKKVGSWWFNSDKFNQKPGEQFVVTNTGGETHTFSCVKEYGGGIVPLLNDLSGNPTPATKCDPNQNDNFLAPGQSSGTFTLTAVGTYKFQCLIHPWMRSTVTVKR